MSYTRFDRHAHMSTETREEILDLTIYRSDEKGRVPFNIENSLYGLFDGYFYDDLMSDVEEFGDEEFTQRVSAVVETVSQYPMF